MKLTFLPCCCLLGGLLLPGLRADSAPAAEASADASWTLTPALASQYLFRGVRLAGASCQSTIEYSRGAALLGLWGNAALEDRAAGDSDPEIDLYGSYTLAVPNTAIEVVPGFSLYTYPDAKRSNGLYSATFEPNIAANFEVRGVRLTPKCFYDFVLKGATFEFTAATAVPLTTLGTELQLSASLGTFRWNSVSADAAPDEKNWGDYWTVGASVPYRITARGTLALGVLYSEGRNNYYKQGTDAKTPNPAAVGRAAVTVSYSISL